MGVSCRVRRADVCGRYSRSHRPQRLSAGLKRTIPSQTQSRRAVRARGATRETGSRDGLSPSLTNPQGTDITTFAQRCPQHPRRPGRDRSEQLVAIRWNGWSRSPVCASIDELPQLVNVLRGEMSLVGPRPHALAHDDEYGGQLGNMRSDIMSNPELRVGLRSTASVEEPPNLI
jgi:hypothetical protein